MFARFEHGNLTFWSRPHLVGATDDDVLANDRNELPPSRREEIRVSLIMAVNALDTKSPVGTC